MKTSLEVTLQRVEEESGRFIRVSVHNVSGEDVYIVTDTVRTDGSRGPYWHSDSSVKNVIVASFVLYPPSRDIFFDHDSASARLHLLHASDTYTARIAAALPIRETVPPYRANAAAHTFIDHEVSGLRVDVAYLPASEKLRKALASKPGGVVNGADFVEYGSSPLSVASSQCIASSSVLPF